MRENSASLGCVFHVHSGGSMLTRDERLREMWHRALAVRRRKAEERRVKVRALLSVGWTGRKIAVALGASERTIYRDAAQMGGRATVLALRRGR